MDANTVSELATMAKRHFDMYWKQDGFICFSVEFTNRKEPGVQVDASVMQDFAPVNEWTLNIARKSTKFPYQHEIVLHGITFFCITVEPI